MKLRVVPKFSSDQWIVLSVLLIVLLLTPTVVTKVYDLASQPGYAPPKGSSGTGTDLVSGVGRGDYEATEGEENALRAGLPEQLTEEIYVIYDGATVVISGETVALMYREQCPYADEYETDSPCVNVVKVREYTEMHLLRLLDGNPQFKIAKSRWGSFSYRVPGNGPDKDQLISDIVSMLSVRSRQYRMEILYGSEGAVAGANDERFDLEIEGKLSPADIEAIANDTVFVDNVEIPGTDGTYADKYIEIDDSQQHLYAWEDGELAADYEVSGFFDEYAVFGVFSVRNKALNAWSPIAEKWMPFWMAFYYDPKQQAWFGLHELVYWTDEEGEYHEESSESIGEKKSGGCIRLDRGEAEKLYDWAEVGMPVLIHP